MPMRRLRYPHGPRRVTGSRNAVITASAAVVLSVLSALGAPAALAAGPTAPATVAARVGANKVPAELVVLVNISASMSWDGLYPKVQQELPHFLGNLRKQDPQDTVAVVVFGTQQDTQTVYFGSPTSSIQLPVSATSSATDFGYAFQKALGILSQARPRYKVGGVLLMSDGELDAPGDPRYATNHSPGWGRLRTLAQGLSMSVTGYGLPLTTNSTFTNSVRTTLGLVFTQRDTLTPDPSDLGQELSVAGEQIMASRVARAVQRDNGRGARVTWIGLPGSGGAAALDLGRTGAANFRVRLTSTTKRVPLSVAGLSVTSNGFPVPITGSLPGGAHRLAPGQSVTLPVHLTWPPASGGVSLFGRSRLVTGRLTLNGRVTSPYSSAIRDTFGDQAFKVGGLAGRASPSAAASVPGGSAAMVWVIIILVILAVAAGLLLLRARLDGSLVLNPPDQDPGVLYMPRRPWVVWPTEDLIRIPGRITVRSSLLSKQMRIVLQLDGATGRGILQPGGRRIIAGVDVIHHPAGTRSPAAGTSSANEPR